MSSLKVEVKYINSIQPHPNADRLELARIEDWNCVVRKGEYAAGHKVVYIPIDSVLPPELESSLFPPDSKVKLDKGRIKTIKLRGAISQGLIVMLDEVGVPAHTAIGTDIAEQLGIKKYEPPQKSTPNQMRGFVTSKKGTNPLFHKYTDIENFKHYPDIFKVGEEVWVSEKLHGTSARYAKLPRNFTSIWGRVKHWGLKLLGFRENDYEFCYGSRNVQLQYKQKWDGFYASNVYSKIASALDLETLLEPGEELYGEIVGSGIQKGYTYGCAEGEHKFFAYDVKVNGRWLDYWELRDWCRAKGIALVPTLYIGKYYSNKVKSLATGDSTIGEQRCREGVVIKPYYESASPLIGRKVLKLINDEYLLKETTEFH